MAHISVAQAVFTNRAKRMRKETAQLKTMTLQIESERERESDGVMEISDRREKRKVYGCAHADKC